MAEEQEGVASVVALVLRTTASIFWHLSGRDEIRGAIHVPQPLVLFPEYENALTPGGGGCRGGCLQRSPRLDIASTGRRIRATDPWLAGVCPWSLLGEYARVCGAFICYLEQATFFTEFIWSTE